MRLTVFPLIILTLLSVVFGQETSTKQATVAILDFDARGITEQEVQTLSERLRTEIGNTGAIRLIERKALEKILAEQGLQQSGCTSDECVAEVGQLLGAQNMISGSIGLMGETYTIDAKLFSVETGEIERTKSVTYEGNIEGLLTEMEILAWEIVGLSAPAKLRLKRAGEEDRPTVAVLDFEGRGITSMEAKTLTDRFSTELSNTEKVLMVERNTMKDVLSAQGFESGGCTSNECAAEVGALLGVQFMINGAIGKIGNTYTIDAKMFSVATGAAESMKNISYQGEVDGLITEIEMLAWSILGLDVPDYLLEKKQLGTTAFLKKQASAVVRTQGGAIFRSLLYPGLGHFYSDKSFWGYGWAGLETAALTFLFMQYNHYQTSVSDFNQYTDQYNAATQPSLISEYRSKAEKSHDEIVAANDMMKSMIAVAATVWVGNTIHTFLIWAGKNDKNTNKKKKDKNLSLGFNPTNRQLQLNWSLNNE